MTIVSTDSSNLLFYMLDPFKRASGKIVFKRGDQDSTMKEISFEEAYCVSYTETFDARGNGEQASMLLSLVISANIIKVGAASLNNKWPS